MAGINAGWSETAPANADNLGAGAGEIRSMKTTVRSAVAAEHVFLSTGGVDTGAHKLGSARIYRDAASALSSDGTPGRLFFNTTNSQFYELSATTHLRIGGALTLNLVDQDLAFVNNGVRPQVHCGLVKTNSAGTAPVTFGNNSGYSGLPYIQLTAYGETGGTPFQVTANVTALSAVSMTVQARRATDGTTASSTTIFWQSTGSVHHLTPLG